MRIIAGKHKNRVIPTIKKADYRPSTTKFREALFSILSSGEFLKLQPIIDANVLDLFAGSGSLSFEALSRGAKKITLIDRNEELLQTAKEFAKKLGEESRITTLCMDATKLSQARDQYSLVFMDPPYYNGYVLKTLNVLTRQGWLAKDAVIAIEMEKRESLQLPVELKLVREKLYGNNKLLILKYEQN